MNVLVSDKKVSPEVAQAYQKTTLEEQQQIQLLLAYTLKLPTPRKKILINSDSQWI